MNDYKWEDFEEGPAPDTKKRIHVTINNRCKIFFNRLALAALGNPDAVSLMYDRRQSVIGVKKTPTNRQSSYRLWTKEKRRSEGRMITAMNFCKRYGIAPAETLAFVSAEVQDGILVLDLNDVRSVAKK